MPLYFVQFEKQLDFYKQELRNLFNRFTEDSKRTYLEPLIQYYENLYHNAGNDEVVINKILTNYQSFINILLEAQNRNLTEGDQEIIRTKISDQINNNFIQISLQNMKNIASVIFHISLSINLFASYFLLPTLFAFTPFLAITTGITLTGFLYHSLKKCVSICTSTTFYRSPNEGKKEKLNLVNRLFELNKERVPSSFGSPLYFSAETPLTSLNTSLHGSHRLGGLAHHPLLTRGQYGVPGATRCP